MTKKPKLISSIRAKLVSAVAMLLVAVIMVVSSTYAWFTLSTAPEITGISTAIGANGALEMALNVGDAPKDAPVASDDDENEYWGNLVNLTDAKYGLQNITLYPSKLNLDENSNIALDSMLQTPKYGEDGRVEKLEANTLIGTYDAETGNFTPNELTGVRGIGASSGMTDRQLSYRNAGLAAVSAMARAKTKASASLNQNGSDLASLAVDLSMNSGATYAIEDLVILKTAIESVRDGAVAEIESAYKYILQAYAASAAVTDEDLWSTVETEVEQSGSTVASVQALMTDISLPAEITAGISALQTTQANITAALAAYEELGASNIGVSAIKNVLKYIVNPEEMTLNGHAISSITSDPSSFVNEYLAADDKNINVVTTTGGGVFADVADHCGEYLAKITIESITYGGLTLTNVGARMNATTTVSPVRILAAGNVVDTAGAPEAGDDAANSMTEYYGYVLDLFFRTNAQDSNLLLQTDAIDRIYKDNAADAVTQGSGSNMTFTATTQELTVDQIKELMGAIRIVFFTPSTEEGVGHGILGYARLDLTDTDATSFSAEGENIAPIKMCDAAGVFAAENVITNLEQNTATAISVLVYLDGDSVTNSSVAATAATSLTGAMNLQFASSANLIPMENGGLHLDDNTPGAGGDVTP